MPNETTATAKPFWQSKTVWLQVLALVCMFIPAVQAWVVKNPVEFVAVLGAVNTLVRWVTSGSISIFPPDDSGDPGQPGPSISPGGENKRGGGAGTALPLLLLVWCMALVTMAGCLVSCTSGEWPVTGSITYRDPGSGAKGGLTFSPGAAPRASVKVPIYDPETGRLIGLTDLSVDLKSGK